MSHGVHFQLNCFSDPGLLEEKVSPALISFFDLSKLAAYNQFYKELSRARETAQQLKSHTAFAKELSSDPSTHAVHNGL